MLGSLAWILRRGNTNKVTICFSVCQTAIVLWIISQLMILFSVTEKQLWISYIIGNIGISTFSPVWLMFSSEFSDIKHKIINYAPVISFLSMIMILTNPIHKIYYADFGTGNITYGILFYVFQIIYYICIIAGITMMCIKHIRGKSRITKQIMLLTLSASVPMAVNTLTVTGIINVGIELTPLFFAFSSIMILIAISRFGLLNINRIAINDTIDNISGGVIVFDSENNLSYINKYAENIFRDIENFDMLRRKTGLDMDDDFQSGEISFESRYYNIKQSFCSDRSGSIMARIIIINNVTEYYELARTERQLSIEQERNRIAQEIHDSAGHTFTLISSLARMLKVRLSDNDEINECISEIDGLSRSGVTQLRCSINNLRDDTFMKSVTGAVRSIADAVRNIDIDLCIQGTEDERYSFCIRQVYDNCRETITNAMRYSDAEHIDIIIKFMSDRLEIYILDNGRGCKKIKENNGMQGIRRRTEGLGGTVRFSSVEGEGFTTIIKIPV
ncbi:MAG: two-component sensor histidine kinase [Ruminococcus sp.]|nr:two-component sensor histidine kinase [Ruminococcus sp.]